MSAEEEEAGATVWVIGDSNGKLLLACLEMCCTVKHVLHCIFFKQVHTRMVGIRLFQ